jgi:hypothetical protein
LIRLNLEVHVYQRSRLGQDDFSAGGFDMQAPTATDIFSGQTADVTWSGYGGPNIEPVGSTSIWSSMPAKADDSWWSGISKTLVPLSAAAANIIRAVTGKTPPPGTMYDPKTGQYITPSTGLFSGSNWLLPAILLGGGVILLLRKRK